MAEDSEDSIPKSVVNAVKGRLSHPVGGIFITAWILINWKMLFFLIVAGSPAEARINASLEYTNWWLALWWPLVATIAYLALAPWAQVGIARWNGWIAKNQAVREYDDELLILRRRREIEQRALQSLQPTVMGQQELMVRLESQIKQTDDRRVAAEAALQELLTLQTVNWNELHELVKFNVDHRRDQPAADRILEAVKVRFDKVEYLKAELAAKYPKFVWDTPQKK